MKASHSQKTQRDAATQDSGNRVRMVRIDAEHEGQRLDNFLLAEFRKVPKSRVYRSVRSGEVRVNKGRSRQNYRLREGDIVRLPPLTQASSEAPPAAPGAQLTQVLTQSVLFEDDQLMVINKPSGLAVHGGSGQTIGLIEAMRAIYPQQRFLDLVHRLDRETSGVLVLAKRRSALVAMHAQLRESEMDKRYLALLQGQWRGGGRRVDFALRKTSGRHGDRMMLVDASGQASSTAFTPLASTERASLMRVRPHTGRTHQIRVHAAALKMPIAGDDRYGNREFNQQLREEGLTRLFLHAQSLKFTHPKTQQTLQIQAPLPTDLRKLCANIGIDETIQGLDQI